jgi:hypothetical protein
MTICFRIGNQEHCFTIPVVLFPVSPWRPGPGPVNYPAFLHDATIVGSFHEALPKVADESVRKALQVGVNNAMQALKTRGGDYVAKISLEGTAGGPPTGGGAHGPGHE